ncbi:type II toxin-antitoxin system HicB family antitoxin [Leptolyngbya sp. KIOST-1]|uniref:type II toxin-antitoxin system HicB family antitoxin n=1 Tax=Leptolyngbya sp. KIOST-1 TaxID=1229172 RepID=UPI00055BCE72|nr:type II toxin-antitoxin system HicB family antitoxin [Leptolyngbya sp. KIOST-1]
MAFQFTVTIEKDDEGYYAHCPQLPGCQSQGETLEEVKANIQEAIELYLETLSYAEKQALAKQEILTMQLEVQVA